MRVTNSMLVSTFMNNLNTNMNKIGDIQTQMQTGRKYASISDDPVSAIYSMQARFRLERLDRYQKGVEMSQNWLTQAESSVMELEGLIKDAYETVLSAASNVKTDSDRANMAEYMGQLRDQVLQSLNTSFGNKYIFAGYDTTGAYPNNLLETPFVVDGATGNLILNGFDLTGFDPNYDATYNTALNVGDPGYDATKATAAATMEKAAANYAKMLAGSDYDPDYDTTLISTDPGYDADKEAAAAAYDTAYDDYLNVQYPDKLAQYNKMEREMIQFWVGNGLTMDTQVNGVTMVGSGPNNLYSILDNMYNIMMGDVPLENMVPALQEYIPLLQDKQSGLLSLAADLGGRANRLEMMADRYETDLLNYTQMKSDAEDADEAELIMMYKMAESVYKAALSTGSYIIQQTLMDFLR